MNICSISDLIHFKIVLMTEYLMLKFLAVSASVALTSKTMNMALPITTNAQHLTIYHKKFGMGK